MQRILDAAAVENELHLIYWFVEAKVPSALSPTGRPQLQAASFPDKWIPVVAVGPAPATSRHYADLLVECFKASNRGIEFGLGLTVVRRVERVPRQLPLAAVGRRRPQCFG